MGAEEQDQHSRYARKKKIKKSKKNKKEEKFMKEKSPYLKKKGGEVLRKKEKKW